MALGVLPFQQLPPQRLTVGTQRGLQVHMTYGDEGRPRNLPGLPDTIGPLPAPPSLPNTGQANSEGRGAPLSRPHPQGTRSERLGRSGSEEAQRRFSVPGVQSEETIFI